MGWIFPRKPEPDGIPEIKPSNLQFINYIRALMILQKIPFAKLRDELKKLPWLDILYVLGWFVWLFMSGLFIWQLWVAMTT